MLRLRPYKPSDADFLLNWLADEKTVEFWRADRFVWPLSREQLRTYYHDFEADSCCAAFTALEEDGTPVGHFSIRAISWEENRGHMGFVIVDPTCRGKGYGRQLVRLACHAASELLGLTRLRIGVFTCNEPALRCYQAEGFKASARPGFQSEFHGEQWNYRYLERELG